MGETSLHRNSRNSSWEENGTCIRAQGSARGPSPLDRRGEPGRGRISGDNLKGDLFSPSPLFRAQRTLSMTPLPSLSARSKIPLTSLADIVGAICAIMLRSSSRSIAPAAGHFRVRHACPRWPHVFECAPWTVTFLPELSTSMASKAWSMLSKWEDMEKAAAFSCVRKTSASAAGGWVDMRVQAFTLQPHPFRRMIA